MKSYLNFSKISLVFASAMLILNIFFIYYIVKNHQATTSLISKFEEVVKLKNDYKDFIQQSISVSRVSPDDVEKTFSSLQNYKGDMQSYVVFIPSDACKACISTFFSEIKKNDIDFNNLYLISEIDDQVLKRLWISFGYDKNKFAFDRYGIFKKSGMRQKIAIIKFQDSLLNYNFTLYDIFLGEIFDEFITNK